MAPDAIDRVLRKYAAVIELDRGYSAHSMRATFITTALENGRLSKTWSAPPDTASRERPSSMTDADIIRRSPRVSLPQLNT